MEQLMIFALLCSIGYDAYNDFQNTLDALFLQNPDDAFLLNLYGRSEKDAVLHALAVLWNDQWDRAKFGRLMMKTLQPIYRECALKEFASKAYQLWNSLPWELQMKEPYFALSYADECLSYGDEKQCRQLYETALEYFE